MDLTRDGLILEARRLSELFQRGEYSTREVQEAASALTCMAALMDADSDLAQATSDYIAGFRVSLDDTRRLVAEASDKLGELSTDPRLVVSALRKIA